MNRLSLQSTLAPLLATLVFSFLTAPIWRWLWGEWMGNDYYSHGLLIPPVVLYLAIQRFRNDKTLYWKPEQGSNYGLIVLALSLAAFLFFLNDKAYYLAAFATVGLLVGLVWTFGGTLVVRKLIFPLGYLLLMIPLPFVERSTLPLAMFTGVCSGGLARFLGLDVNIVGNSVTLPNADLVIGAQCSGVNSLIALTALMALAAYLLEGPLWGRVTLVVLSVPLAVLGNILRVASLLFVARAYNAEVAFIYYHDYSGLVFFVLVLLLMVPLTQLLQTRSVRLDVI
jgi:exosortase